MKLSLSFSALISLFSFESFAEENTWPEFNGVVAIAASQENLPYAGVDTEVVPSLLVFGQLGHAFIEGNRVGYPIKRFGFATLSALGQLRTHQYLDADDTPLTHKDREKSIELGPQLSVPLGGGIVSQFSVLQDISGKHNSQEVEAAAYKRFVFDHARVITTYALQYQSGKLVDYYVGTDSYRAKGDLTQELEVLGVYDMTPNWSATLVWRYYLHGNEFKNSPLITDRSTQRFAIGIGRHF